MAKRRPPKPAEAEADTGDLAETQESIEAELAALQQGLERLRAQLAERRQLHAALRALTGLPKRKAKAAAQAKPATRKGKP